MKTRSPWVVLTLVFALAGCSGVGSGSHLTPADRTLHPNDTLGGVGNMPVPVGGPNMQIVLVDAPPEIGGLTPTEIDLGVTAVNVISDGTVVPIAQYASPDVVNILAHQTDPAPIGIGQYFQGSYQQIQFTFDVASSKIVANDTNYPISFLASSALSSAGAGATTTTVNGNGTVTVTVSGNYVDGSNPAAAIEADFNALESFARDASGAIVSRPTIFAVPFDAAGKIAGTVVNASGGAVAGATVVALDANGHVANTTATDASGAYEMHTLAAGSYSLEIYNNYTTASGETEAATGASRASASIAGPTITVNAQSTTQVPPIAD